MNIKKYYFDENENDFWTDIGQYLNIPDYDENDFRAIKNLKQEYVSMNSLIQLKKISHANQAVFILNDTEEEIIYVIYN